MAGQPLGPPRPLRRVRPSGRRQPVLPVLRAGILNRSALRPADGPRSRFATVHRGRGFLIFPIRDAPCSVELRGIIHGCPPNYSSSFGSSGTPSMPDVEPLGELVPIGGGDAITLIRPLMTIGRRESNDICLKFANVSGQHCELAFKKGV